jgi:hypothetical protein
MVLGGVDQLSAILGNNDGSEMTLQLACGPFRFQPEGWDSTFSSLRERLNNPLVLFAGFD